MTVIASTEAAAHVAPAVKDNNRYVKITPMANRVRLAYTIYIGEIPGQQARIEMDADRNGELSDSEAAGYKATLAEAVRNTLTLTVDGAEVPVTWDEIHIGLGTPETNAGAFAVDLVAWACLGRGRAGSAHSVVFFDRYEVNRPGETELRVEESPDVKVERSTFGADGKQSEMEFKWTGRGGPTATLGYYLDFTVQSTEPVASDTRCPAIATADQDQDNAEPPRRRWLVLGSVAALAVAIAACGMWWIRRSGQSVSEP